MPNFYNEQSLKDLKPSPELSDCASLYEERLFGGFVFVGIQTIFIDCNVPLFPNIPVPRFFKNNSIDIWIFDVFVGKFLLGNEGIFYIVIIYLHLYSRDFRKPIIKQG